MESKLKQLQQIVKIAEEERKQFTNPSLLDEANMEFKSAIDHESQIPMSVKL